MIEISLSRAAEFMKRDVFHNLGGLMAVELNIPAVPQRVFADSEQPSVLMHVQDFTHWVNGVFTGYDPRFVDECADWLRSNHGACRPIGDDARLFTGPELSRYFNYGQPRRIPHLVCTSLEIAMPIGDPRIRILTESDRPAAERFAERYDNPQGLLDSCTAPGHTIYGAIESGEMLGYVAAGHAYGDIWDVWNIQVGQDVRGQGLGAKLAAFYARDVLTRSLIPYYSGACNEASERTAKRAGFTLCREDSYADAKPHAQYPQSNPATFTK